MNKYEILYIVNPELSEEEMSAEAEKYKAFMEQNGEVTNIEKWGKKRLAYEVKKFREGYYVLMNVVTNPETINEINRLFKISETVIRHLIIREEEK